MGLQLLFCVETNSDTNSDYIYIREAVFHLYDIDQAHTRIRAIYLNGKGNYRARRVLNDIREQTKQYAAAAENNRTVVIYCIDCDRYDSNPTDAAALKTIRTFCETSGYEFAWFCRDCEHVFLGRQVEDNQKKREAEKFFAHKRILHVDSGCLKAEDYQLKHSNLCRVLDKYLC